MIGLTNDGYLYYLIKYKLNTADITLISEVEQLQNVQSFTNSKIIIIDDDKLIRDFVLSGNWKEEGPAIYKSY